MMRIFAVMSMVLACALPLSQAHSAGWTQFRQIQELNQQPAAGTNASELVFVILAPGTNPSGCSTGNTFHFAVSNDRHKRIFAMLMAAQAAGRTVMLYTTGACHVTDSALLDGAVIGS
ncbi:hypothetical protein ACFPN2_26365 [Steroidobacter flavus]|uniref:Uncharacterized protein n=1 Tax=Steroidobacter flavus TaxID=1842136 RepID=A0ABV8SYI4_9GAMM